MTLAAMMVRSVQSRQTNDVYLVGCQHIDLTQADIRDGMTNIYDLSGAIAHDIAGTESARGHAQVIDEQMGRDSASRVARLVLMASLPIENQRSLEQDSVLPAVSVASLQRTRRRRRR